jgi:hypothetical protein
MSSPPSFRKALVEPSSVPLSRWHIIQCGDQCPSVTSSRERTELMRHCGRARQGALVHEQDSHLQAVLGFEGGHSCLFYESR